MTSIELDKQHSILIVNCDPVPHDDEFELWGKIFLHHSLITILEFEAGADRHLLRFQYQTQNFNLNFEHYSDSVWICAEGVEAETLLPELHSVLSPN